MSLVQHIPCRELELRDRSKLLTSEWLVTNGLGGYSSGTVAGVATRRYHGLLVASLPAPLGRRMVASNLAEYLQLPDGRQVQLSGERYPSGDVQLGAADYLTGFRLDMGLPVWQWEVDGITVEKQIALAHKQSTVYVIYRMLSGEGPLRLTLVPSIHHRSHDDPVNTPLPGNVRLTEIDGRYEFSVDEMPPLHMLVHGHSHTFTIKRQVSVEEFYEVEERRGYEHRGSRWVPGFFCVDLSPDQPTALVASTEPWEAMTKLDPNDALLAEIDRRAHLLSVVDDTVRKGIGTELVLAADQFLVTPIGRAEEAAQMRAEGDEARTVIAGYHWFTDWGRDTMISLEGLALTTGRFAEAGYILRTFARAIRDGLVPNMFPEGEKEGLYHTADATLWFFHAIDRYLAATADLDTLEMLLPKLIDSADHHLRGTRFGISVDPEDSLLHQGQEGFQLTWMDAKVQDWVVTPRRGKAVEINALWYNALCLLAQWTGKLRGDREAELWLDHAKRTRESFNRRFWYEGGGYLYDVVDGEQGDDSACRPNQVLAISLGYPVLDAERWEAVLSVVKDRLLTPVGLRSLSPDHPNYCPQYFGNLRARDAAYHQGTVWAWLIGPFIDAWLKTYPQDFDTARGFLAGFEQHLSEGCIGSISEIFDAEPPFTPRGCISQAWSVAEVLRSLAGLEQQSRQ
jgi:predicted glycogen debranching enzyme